MAKYNVNEINNYPILEVASALGLDAKKKGVVYKALCVWHDDHTPSMQIGGRRNICYCYSCGNGGNVIDLVMAARNTDFLGACEWMTDRFPETKPLTRPSGTLHSGGRGKYGKKAYNSLHEMERLVRHHRASGNQGSPPWEGSGEVFMTFERDYLLERINLDNSFCRCLSHVFGKAVAMDVARKYWLGTQGASGRYPDVIFPLIDRYGQLRDMKVQSYECDERSERFFHKTNVCYWLGGKLFPEETFNRNCLFGEHLLQPLQPLQPLLRPSGTSPSRGEETNVSIPNEGSSMEHSVCNLPSPPEGEVPEGWRGGRSSLVMLVESPKNACIGAAAYPEYTWVAAGNKNMLKREVLEPLRGRNVIVYPDEDAYDEWSQILSTMKDIAPFNVQHVPMAKGKEDIADFILRKLRIEN